jgi:hypothetical protein
VHLTRADVMSILRYASLVVLVVPLAAHAGPGSQEVVALRLEVEQLARTLDEHRGTAQAELAGLRTERAELQRQLRLARVRNRTLVKLEQQDAAADEARRLAADEWNAPARAAVEAAREHVLRSLPFATASRLETLDRIDAELAGAAVDVGRAMERLWRFVEEEAAMSREVTLARQQIAWSQSDDGPRLCDVLRIGMAAMYVRCDDGANDGQVGWARPAGEAWTIEAITEPTSVAVIRGLFTAADDNEIFAPQVLLVPGELADVR